MTITARVICDSVSPDGVRLTTMVLRYPRFIHAEFMTHRVFSRNAASSRAIPVSKMIEMVRQDPAMPIHWGKNQKGMQAREELDADTEFNARCVWSDALDTAVNFAEDLADLGVHKQIVNRILEPYMHIEVVVTATEWTNFFALRRHEDAQPEIKALADAMHAAMSSSTPEKLGYGDWHIPFIEDATRVEAFDMVAVDSVDEKYGSIRSHNMPAFHEILRQCSVARCARVSYLTHEGTRDIQKDLALYEKLLTSRHLSPFEHIATPMKDFEYLDWNNMHFTYAPSTKLFSGNFRGWVQLRKTIEGENGES